MEENIIEQFCNANHEINIDKQSWSELNKLYSKENIIESLIINVLNGNIKLPLRDITYDEAMNDFKCLCDMKPLPFEPGDTYTKYEYKLPASNLYIKQSNVGNKASDYFQQYNRYCCGSDISPSPVKVWSHEKYLRSLFGALWSLKYDVVNMLKLRKIITLRKYIASQFKPSTAKSIYSNFNSKIVLDFSAGWGDRLCGFFGTDQTEYYMGLDPNTKLHSEYQNQIKMYKSIMPNKEVDMICSPAEDFKYPSNSFDTVFTSPPYFGREKYSDDKTQSYLRYKKIDNWVNNFLCVSIEKTWDSLKTNGTMIINISDIYKYSTKHDSRICICDDMNDFINNKLHGNFIGCIGMKMTKRLNCNSIKEIDGIFVEPIWIWSKK